MSPRPYQLGRRQEGADETRKRILAAARTLLAGGEGFSGFTMEAVAKKANVARMTVYYQFESKARLLEAVGESLAERALVERLQDAFRQSAPLDALEALVRAFAHFWTAERLVIRRFRAVAALDPELAPTLRGLDDRRRGGLSVILHRLAAARAAPAPDADSALLDLLVMLTSFEAFDLLAGDARTPEDVTPLILGLVRQALGLATL